ncbi:MAG: DUF4339 domain-containing protein [Akkermansiaceae bacterium]
MSEQTWYFIDGAGTQQGPITTHQLQSLTANGSITEDTQMWTETLGEQWIPASNIEGLFPTQTATQAPALRTSAPVAVTPRQADTVPMIPSTPTTQAVTGVPVPASYAAAQQPAAANPYQSPTANPEQLNPGIYPATITKGGSMSLWTMLFTGGLLLILLGFLLGAKIEGFLGLGLMVAGFACIFFSGILTYIYLYKAWKCLQPGGATISPGAAIGFLFIPIFNIYWLFKAIGGLPKQWNLITSCYPNTKNAPKLTMGAFICLLLIPIIGQIIWLSQITKGLNFMAALHFQQARPAGSALAGLGSRAHFK